MRRAELLPLTLLVAAITSCGPQRRGPLVNAPVIPDTVAERRGERLFFQHCSKCHPGGETKLDPALNDKPLPELAIETQIRQGLGAMPAFSEHHLKDAEVEAIAEYVREMRKTPTPEPGRREQRETERSETSAAR